MIQNCLSRIYLGDDAYFVIIGDMAFCLRNTCGTVGVDKVDKASGTPSCGTIDKAFSEPGYWRSEWFSD